MELINRTKFHAQLFRGVINLKSNRMFGSLAARVTYDICGDQLRVSDTQSWKVSAPPWDCQYCPMDSDELFYRGGVDLFVFGSACAPTNQMVSSLEVKIDVGKSFSHRLIVIGDRVWKRQGKNLAASSPRPFNKIPLTLARAFGGKDVWDELVVPFPDNATGMGYYVQEQNAVGKPLPNIEHPKHRISKWDDRPDPVGMEPCPTNCGVRTRNSVVFDMQTRQLKELKSTFFNSAFPEMIVPRVVPGERVTLHGFSPNGSIEFFIPDSGLTATVKLGNSHVDARLPIDQIGVMPDLHQAFISYRYPYRYTIAPMILRSCTLTLT